MTEALAYWGLEPRGELRADLRTAHQTGFVAMLAGNKPIPIDNLTLSFDPQIAGEWGDVYPEVDDSDVVAGETHDDPDSEDVEADRATLSAWVASMKGQAKRRR